MESPSADINMIFRKIMDYVVNDSVRKYDDICLTLSRPRVVTTTPTGVIKKILICPSVLIIESRPQPIYILYYLPTNFLYSSSSFLHASDSDRPS